MEEHGILVADKDTEFLREVTDHFSDAGYQVETTHSAVHIISSILEKQTPVVLLGSDFDKKINLVELLQFLKKCNRHLAVILVSDEESLPVVKKVRKEGVFQYALRPVNEFKQSVGCTFSAA
ncbi:MAG: response regulator [Desulfuromonadaceae bacterium]|nr:response regulator [Desulfuromonadaceae bacterium]MDD5107255.1 response regulator [Desulfuromonadaceae bacterium]